MPRYVLLDRDGVINRQIPRGYVTSWDQFDVLPGALDALRMLAENDWVTLVVSNQQGVGKGLMTMADLEEITRRFVQEVEANGGRIAGVYYCPHLETDGCSCRKPRPGLLQQAQRDHQFDFAEAFLIGDSVTDLKAAQEVGCPALLVSDGDTPDLESLTQPPIGIFPSLYAAVQHLLNMSPGMHPAR